MDWNLIIGIASFIFGIVSFITGIIFYQKSKRTKEPCFSVKTETLIAGYSAKFKDLTIQYKDKEIENLSVSRIAFWNDGNETIDSDDIAPKGPLLIVPDEGIEILDAKVLEQTNRSSNFSLHPLGKYTQILFDYIDREQGAVFQVIHTGTYPYANLTIWGYIKGAKGVSRKLTEKTPLFGWIMVTFFLSMFWILSIMYFTFGITNGFELIPVPISWIYYVIIFLALVLTPFVMRQAIKESKYHAKVPKGLKSYEVGKE